MSTDDSEFRDVNGRTDRERLEQHGQWDAAFARRWKDNESAGIPNYDVAGCTLCGATVENSVTYRHNAWHMELIRPAVGQWRSPACDGLDDCRCDADWLRARGIGRRGVPHTAEWFVKTREDRA